MKSCTAKDELCPLEFLLRYWVHMIRFQSWEGTCNIHVHVVSMGACNVPALTTCSVDRSHLIWWARCGDISLSTSRQCSRQDLSPKGNACWLAYPALYLCYSNLFYMYFHVGVSISIVTHTSVKPNLTYSCNTPRAIDKYLEMWQHISVCQIHF